MSEETESLAVLVDKLADIVFARLEKLEDVAKCDESAVKIAALENEVADLKAEMRQSRTDATLSTMIGGLDATIRAMNAPKKIIRDPKTGRASCLEPAVS